jgi:hypothetical protein
MAISALMVVTQKWAIRFNFLFNLRQDITYAVLCPLPELSHYEFTLTE